jgi:ATP-dependent protease Clp ATPase subunit
MFLIEVKKVFIAKKKIVVHDKQNAVAIDTLQIVYRFGFIFSHMISFVKENKMSRRSGVSCRDGVDLLVAKHGLDHLTTTDGEDREERITQL